MATGGDGFKNMSINAEDQTDSNSLADKPTLSLLERIRKALGPALPGITLDLIDAMSLTQSAGPFASFPLGCLVGIWLSSYYRFSWGWKALIAVSSGLYTLTPGTEMIPLATILTCLGRFVEATPDLPTNGFRAESTAANSHAENIDVTSESIAAAVEPSPASEKSTQRGQRTGAKCPECESMSLKYGQVGQRFWPTGCSAWSKGHEVNAFVCLDCGFVGHFLSATDLESLG